MTWKLVSDGHIFIAISVLFAGAPLPAPARCWSSHSHVCPDLRLMERLEEVPQAPRYQRLKKSDHLVLIFAWSKGVRGKFHHVMCLWFIVATRYSPNKTSSIFCHFSLLFCEVENLFQRFHLESIMRGGLVRCARWKYERILLRPPQWMPLGDLQRDWIRMECRLPRQECVNLAFIMLKYWYPYNQLQLIGDNYISKSI